MIDSRYFKVDQNGKISASAGEICGFKISDAGYISYGKTSYSENTNNGVYLGTDGIGLGKGKFYVTSAGKLYATDANITGSVTAGTCHIDENILYFVKDKKAAGLRFNDDLTYLSLSGFISNLDLPTNVADQDINLKLSAPEVSISGQTTKIEATSGSLSLSGSTGIKLAGNTEVTGKLMVSTAATDSTIKHDNSKGYYIEVVGPGTTPNKKLYIKVEGGIVTEFAVQD
jgi:hypothetical protein